MELVLKAMEPEVSAGEHVGGQRPERPQHRKGSRGPEEETGKEEARRQEKDSYRSHPGIQVKESHQGGGEITQLPAKTKN